MTWELRCCDNMDQEQGLPSLPDKSVDHVITDPPYSERVHRRLGQEGRNDGVESRDALSFGALTEAVAEAVAWELQRVARRWILVFADELSLGVWVAALETANAEYVRKGTYVKSDAMPQMSGDRPATGTEEIVIAHGLRKSGRMRWNGGGRAAVYRGRAQADKRVHPAQKPLWLMEALVRDFTEPGETILDPFGGSGTTLVAAKRLGRHALGYEQDAKTAEQATTRLRGFREQLTMGV